MSLAALMQNNGATWRNLFVNSIQGRNGYLRVVHCVTFVGATGAISSQTGGLTVVRNSAGSYTVNYSSFGLANIPWVGLSHTDGATQLTSQINTAATTASFGIGVSNMAGAAADPTSVTVQIVENG